MDQANNNAKIVRAMFDAFVRRDRDEAEALLAPDFTFTSPYDDVIDRDEYFRRCWPNGDTFADFRVERVTGDADGAYITYFLANKDGTSFRNSEYLTVQAGRITSVNVYFGASYRNGKFERQSAKA